MDEKDNVFRFGSVKGGKDTEEGLPVDNYTILDIDDIEWEAEGFLVFTPDHVAVMRDFGRGALPVLGLPLLRVKSYGLSEEIQETETDLPF